MECAAEECCAHHACVCRTFGVLVAECPLSHIAQPHHSLACAVQEVTAVSGVELSRSDDFSQVLHVGRLDVNNVCRQSRH